MILIDTDTDTVCDCCGEHVLDRDVTPTAEFGELCPDGAGEFGFDPYEEDDA